VGESSGQVQSLPHICNKGSLPRWYRLGGIVVVSIKAQVKLEAFCVALKRLKSMGSGVVRSTLHPKFTVADDVIDKDKLS
jgi:hypothetical protein